MNQSVHTLMNTRKITAIILSIIFVFQIAGCKNETPQEVTQEEITITFAAYDGLHDLLTAIADDFHTEHPEITVEIVSLPDHQAVSESGVSYEEALATNADCTLLNNGVAHLDQYFLDIEPIYSTDEIFNPNDYWKNSLTACENKEGHVYCLPHRIFYHGVFFDEIHIELASLPLPDIDWKWDDFYAYVEFLAASDATGTGGTVYSNNGYSTSLYLQIGENLVENNGQLDVGKLEADTETFISFVEKDGVSISIDPQTASQTEDALLWHSALAREIDRVSGDEGARIATVPIPGAKMPLFVEGFGISAGSTNPTAAWEWIKFLNTYPFSNNEGSTPTSAIYAVKSLAENSNVWEMLTEESQEAVAVSLENMISVYPYKNEQNYVYNSMLEVVRGERCLEDAISTINQEMPQAIIAMEAPVSAEVVVATPVSDQATVNLYVNEYIPGNSWVLREVVDEFNKAYQPDLPISISYTYPSGTGEHFERLTNNFDCFVTQNTPNQAATSDLILDLTPLFSAEDSVFKNDFDAETLAMGQYQGKQYILPFSIKPPIAVYNVDLLNTMGIPLPTNDWEYSDFLAAIIGTTTQSAENITYGFMPYGGVNYRDIFFEGHDVEWLFLDGEIPKVQYLSDEMISMIQHLEQLKDQGVFFSSEADGGDWWIDMTSTVEDGRVAFWFAPVGEEIGVTSNPYPDPEAPFDFEIEMVSLPISPDYVPITSKADVNGFYISKNSNYSEVCWDLAKFLTSNPQTYQKALPFRTSVLSSPDWLNLLSDNQQAAYMSALEKSSRQLSSREYLLIYPYNRWLGDAIWEITTEGRGPEVVFPEYQLKADNYYNCLVENNAGELDDSALEELVDSCKEQAEGGQ